MILTILFSNSTFPCAPEYPTTTKGGKSAGKAYPERCLPAFYAFAYASSFMTVAVIRRNKCIYVRKEGSANEWRIGNYSKVAAKVGKAPY